MLVESQTFKSPVSRPAAATHSKDLPPRLRGDSLVAMLHAARLPTDKLTASEVIGQRLVALSMKALWQAVEAGRLFVMPERETGVAVFPAWQFGPPAQALIVPVIRALRAHPEAERWLFWSIEWEELGDLTCAEVLCGRLHDYRDSVSLADLDYLCAPDADRLRTVMRQLASLPSRLLQGEC